MTARLFVLVFACVLMVRAQSDSSYDSLAKSQLERARAESGRVEKLVDEGTLPRAKLAEAEEAVNDAEDNLVLAQTLYSENRLEDMTAAQAEQMTGAARRRVERQEKVVAAQRGLVTSGILAPADFEASEQELESRRHVLDLAENRAQVLTELQTMAEAERRLEQPLPHLMTRYDGNRAFHLSNLAAISKAFQRRFGRPLPVSALGQTAVHRAMGLDHRDRADVALSPDSVEGRWLRQFLEQLGIPYLAFRSALLGAATAPHIHIGAGSPRLLVAGPNQP